MAKAFSGTGTTVGLSSDRTAITSPATGMQFYESDTNTLYIYTGSAWVALASAAAPPGMQLLSTNTFSGSTGVGENSIFSSTYDNYKIVYRFSTSTTAGIYFRLRISGSDVSSGYYWSEIYNPWSTTVTGNGAANAAYAQINYNTDTAEIGGTFDVVGPFLTGRTIITGTSSGGNVGRVHNCLSTNTSSHNGYVVYPSTGTITGVLKVYGYRNSI